MYALPAACKPSPQPGAVPVEQLQALGFLGAEHEDGPSERILAQLVFHQRSQAVMAFAEVDGPGRHPNPHPVRREDHEQAGSAMASSATRAAGMRHPAAPSQGQTTDQSKQLQPACPPPARRTRLQQSPAQPACPAAQASATQTGGSPSTHGGAPPRSL